MGLFADCGSKEGAQFIVRVCFAQEKSDVPGLKNRERYLGEPLPWSCKILKTEVRNGHVHEFLDVCVSKPVARYRASATVEYTGRLERWNAKVLTHESRPNKPEDHHRNLSIPLKELARTI